MVLITTPMRPNFVADWESVDRDTGHTIDWALVGNEFRVGAALITSPAGAAAAAVSLPVSALTVAIPAGTLLTFGTLENVRVTTAAAVGAVALAVDPLPDAIEAGDTAAYVPNYQAPKVVPAGTRMGVTGTTNGRMAPRTATNPAEFILLTDAVEPTGSAQAGHLNRGAYGVIRGGVLYENLLPGATGSPATINATEKTELQTAGRGTGYAFVQYRDSTA